MIEELTRLFSKLPSAGRRSARRFVLHLLQNKEDLMIPLAEKLLETANNIKFCSTCGNFDTVNPCKICSNSRRNNDIICVVENVGDLWAIERSSVYKGVYHVLGGNLSVLEGKTPEDINIPKLIERAKTAQEIILATNATVEGQTTAHYIMEQLAHCDVKITRLAQGIPIGAELDYIDDGTLGTAFNSRRDV